MASPCRIRCRRKSWELYVLSGSIILLFPSDVSITFRRSNEKSFVMEFGLDDVILCPSVERLWFEEPLNSWSFLVLVDHFFILRFIVDFIVIVKRFFHFGLLHFLNIMREWNQNCYRSYPSSNILRRTVAVSNNIVCSFRSTILLAYWYVSRILVTMFQLKRVHGLK